MILNINFSSRTTSIDVQRNLEANVEKRTKDTFGPPPGKRLIVSIDDMNMPQVREGGARGDERGGRGGRHEYFFVMVMVM